MPAKIEDIRLLRHDIDGFKEIRLDFDNDRHHAVMVRYPYTNEHLCEALRALENNLRNDPHLK